MGHRLSKITTRTGDAGQTGLATGERIHKTHPRVIAMGEVDELNAVIGVWRAQVIDPRIQSFLEEVSQDLFNLGGELAMPGEELLSLAALEKLDAAIAEWNATLPPLKEFILPGGPPPVAWAHMARTVCRRAERSLWQLDHTEVLRSTPAQYLNRLSDVCFVLGRVLAATTGATETPWAHQQ